MRKQTAGGKSTTRWRLSFWRFSIGFRIITVLFHKKQSVRQDGLFFYKKGDLNSRGHLERSRRKSGMLLILLYLIYRKLLHLIDFGKKTSAQ